MRCLGQSSRQMAQAAFAFHAERGKVTMPSARACSSSRSSFATRPRSSSISSHSFSACIARKDARRIRKTRVRDGRGALKNSIVVSRFLGCPRRECGCLCRSPPARHSSRLAHRTPRRPRACQAKAPGNSDCCAFRDQRIGIAT